MLDTEGGAGDARSALAAEYLREAVAELEVWRQNARSVEERQALRRVTSLLIDAGGVLRGDRSRRDGAQHLLPLPEAGAEEPRA